ncbi:MAG TPA: hypothetical protein VK815_18360 [Candidatus Acidoferrales bacterium]|nr:hypothetical protein [Candidatus Acidoferrales bacterium]
MSLFFREGHGAEKGLFPGSGIFLPGFRLGLGLRGFRLRGLLTRAAGRLVTAGFIPSRFIPALIPARFIAARLVPSWFIATLIALRRLHLPGRLDASECAAKFIDLPLICQFLALGQFYEFEDLIQLVDRMLERLGDLCRMQNCLVDCGGRCWTEVGGLHPLFRTQRLLAAFRRTVVLRLVLRMLGMARRFPLFRRRGIFPARFRCGCIHGLGFRGGKISGFLGMRLAKTARILGFRGFGGI